MAEKSFYPHLHVGNISKISSEAVENNLVTYDITPSTLLDDLVEAVEDSGTYEDLVTIAQAAITSGSVLRSTQELYTLIPTYNAAVEMLATNDHTTIIIPADFTPIADESELWDSLFAQFIVNENAALIQELARAVKFVGLLKKIQATEITTTAQVLAFWKRGLVVYPNPPFPLPKVPAETVPGVPSPPVSDSEQTLISQLAKFEKAREEIIGLYDKQLQSLKSKKLDQKTYEESLKMVLNEDKPRNSNASNNVPIDPITAFNKYVAEPVPEQLREEAYSAISGDTKSVITGMGLETTNLDVHFATRRIDQEIRKIATKLSQFSKFDHVTLIGNMLVSVDNAVTEDLICNPEETFSHCQLLHELGDTDPERTYVQVLGMGHVNVIRQKLLRYEADEIAHIENVLAGETKSKTHRNLKVQEETVYSESERSEETETDTKTSERFEMSKEMNKIASSSSQFEAGVSVSAGYGPVSLSANVGFASQNSSMEASATAMKNARELSERAVNRIEERVLEIRSTTTINEVEITNLHEISNAGSEDHINGFYYWVDKVYENQVHNLGKRLMLEFMVPEPAAYHIYSSAFSKKEGVTLEKPVHPRDYKGVMNKPLTSHKDINRSNYNIWAGLYNVQDITSPPLEFLTVSKSYALDYVPGGKAWNDKEYNDLVVKEGYQATTAFVRVAFSSGSGRYISGYIGRKPFHAAYPSAFPPIALDNETDLVPLSFRGNFDEFNMNVEILCSLSDKGYEDWQITTYNSIINAYNAQKAEYDFQVSSLEAGITISGQNPILNRKTEQTELKKWGIELLTLQRLNGMNAMKRATNGHPEIDFTEAFEEGKFVRFFEQSIEWSNMTYLFYPYFWSPKQRWSITKQLGDTDQKFADFLQAGYARVVVPVHPKFTEAILHYLNTGQIWEGEELPAFDDELYLSIVDEIRQAEDTSTGIAEGDPWETRVPTNMVVLSAEIPVNLPGS